MDKGNQSYSNTTSSDSDKSAYIEVGEFYNSEKTEKEVDSHDVFEKSDYSVRKMTFGKIKYVQK